MPILHIGRVTFQESVRQPLGLVLTLLLSLLILFAPAFTSFNLGEGIELRRSNLLSTLLMGGVIYASITSTQLIQREIQQKTILSLLTRPVSIVHFYLGKLLGTFTLIALFSMLLCSVGWVSLVIGTPDSSSTVLNFVAPSVLAGYLVILALLGIALNYTMDFHIISFFTKAWAIGTPLVIGFTLVLSPVFRMPLPDFAITFEYLKAAALIALLVMVIAAFSIAIGTFTGPIVNLLCCLLFLFAGLISPGLSTWAEGLHPIGYHLFNLLPDFHVFWMAEMISLGHSISAALMGQALLYSLSLIAGFSFFGIFALHRRDFS